MITEQILREAAEGNLEPLREVPKTDLHAHLLLSAPHATLSELAENPLEPLPERFDSLDHFLHYVRGNCFPIFRSVDVYRRVMRDCFDHMISDGIVYTELSFDTAMPLLVGLSWAELVPELKKEIDRVSGRLVIRPELGLARDFTHAPFETLTLEAMKTGFFGGIDLYGAETLRPVTDFNVFFDRARDHGLKIKLHTGESGGPERVMSELRAVRPDAVQHGVRAAEHPEAATMLADMGIEVNVCPWSNYLLSVVEKYEAHPIRELFDAGVRVTVNSDDYSIFRRSVSEEYLALHRCGLFSADELESIRQNGLRASRESGR